MPYEQRILDGYVVIHRTGAMFLGRNGEVKDWPILFAAAEHAQALLNSSAQIPADWVVSGCTLAIPPNNI